MGIYYGKLKHIHCNNQNISASSAWKFTNILLATKPSTYCAQNTMEMLESIYSNATFLLELQNRLIFPVKYYKKEKIVSGTEFFLKKKVFPTA